MLVVNSRIFMRSDGATCAGYCGCLPTRHSKKNAPTPLMAHPLYNSDKLRSVWVDKLSLYFSYPKINLDW